MTTLVISHSTHLSYIFIFGLGTRMYTTTVRVPMRCDGDGDGLSPIQLESLKGFSKCSLATVRKLFIAIPTDFNNYEGVPRPSGLR